jgi:hypothetical protein
LGFTDRLFIGKGKQTKPFTLWLFNIAVENGPFIDDFPIKTSIYKGFSMAMLNKDWVRPPCLLVNLLVKSTCVLPMNFFGSILCWLYIS